MFIFSRPNRSDSRERNLFEKYPDSNKLIYSNTVDPIIEVSVLEQKKFTSAKTDIGPTGVVMWSEHLFFEPKKLVRFKSLSNFNFNLLF
jgi:hypothetical protein